MSTVASGEIEAWLAEASALRATIAARRQTLRADPSSGQDDPMRTGLDAAFDSLSTTLSIIGHLWVLADISQ